MANMRQQNIPYNFPSIISKGSTGFTSTNACMHAYTTGTINVSKISREPVRLVLST